MIIINIIQDIIEIVKNDSRHHIKVVVDDIYFTVYLDDDPDEAYEEKYLIPIRYDCCSDFCYIPHNEYCEVMCNNDFGIDLDEINLIQKIMQYMENNKNMIKNICRGFSLNKRKHLTEEIVVSNSVEQLATD